MILCLNAEIEVSSRVLLQEFSHLRRKFLGRHLCARGYLAVSSGNITDEMIKKYIEEQEGEQVVDDSQFPIEQDFFCFYILSVLKL